MSNFDFFITLCNLNYRRDNTLVIKDWSFTSIPLQTHLSSESVFLNSVGPTRNHITLIISLGCCTLFVELFTYRYIS